MFAPAPADAQTTIWTSTLTVDRYASGGNVWHGCSTDSSNYDGCTTALSDRHISVSGAGTYEIRVVVIYTVSGVTKLGIKFNPTTGGSSNPLPESFAEQLTLTIDGSKLFTFATGDRDVQNAGAVAYIWDSPGIQWSDNQQVSLKLKVPPPIDPPSEPRNFRATAGDDQITLNWDAPSSWGSWRADAFEIEWRSDTIGLMAWRGVRQGEFQFEPGASESSFVFSGTQLGHRVTNRVSYDFRIRARAQQTGKGNLRSDWVEVSVDATAPPRPPRQLQVTAGNAELGVTWVAPPLDDEVTGYDVHYTSLSAGYAPDTWPALDESEFYRYRPGNGWVAVSRSGTSLSQTISGLAPGTTYRVRVRARNSAGAGGWVVGTGTTYYSTATISFAVSTLRVIEGSVVPDLRLNLSGPLSNDVSLTLPVTAGSAESGDYQIATSSITIPAGQLFGTLAGGSWANTVGDADEDDETFTVSLPSTLPSLLVAGNPASATVTIVDDDGKIRVSFAEDRMTLCEGGPQKYLPELKLSGPPGRHTSIRLTGDKGTAESRDHSFPGVATINISRDGLRQTPYAIRAHRDGGADYEEFTVEIDTSRLPDGFIEASPSKVTVTINDDDLYGQDGCNVVPPKISVADDRVSERAERDFMRFVVTLDRAGPGLFKNFQGSLVRTDDSVTVQYTTEAVTATQGTDYEVTTGTLVFEKGRLRKEIHVPVIDDNVEDSGETFRLVLFNPQGAVIERGVAIGTIFNHEDDPQAELGALSVEGAPGAGGPFAKLDIGTFAAGTTAYAVTVPHGTTHARLTATVGGAGLTLRSGAGSSLTAVQSGAAGAAIPLSVGSNALKVEATAPSGVSKTYRVTVTRQAAAAVAVSLSATPNPVGEGSPVTVRATLTAALVGDVTIPLSTRRDTSEEGDHGSLSAITVPAGFTSATGTLPTFEDSDGEDETFTLSLGSLPTGLTAGATSSVQVTITKQQSSGATTTDTSTTTSSSDTTTSSSGVSPTASGPDGETLLVGFGQIAQTPPEVSIALDGAAPISEGEEARFRVSRTGSTTAPLSVNLEVRENQEEGQDFVAAGNEGNKTLTIPAGQDSALYTVPTDNDDMDEANGSITVTVETGTGYTLHGSDDSASVDVHDNDAPVAAPPTEENRAWQIRFGRSVSQQVVDALQQRFSTTTPSGLQLTLAGETLTSDTPLEENHVLLSRLLGFESVSGQELAQGSSFSFSTDGAGPRLSFWGKGAFSSFNGIEESITLTGDVTTALLGAEWSNERWRAGAALSHSWGNGSHQGEGDAADGRISSSLTGIFPYGRYALTPRLGVWATAGYGWGAVTLNPDGEGAEYNPATTLALGAVGMDGLLLDGGREGVTLTTTADALFLKTGSEAVEGLASSEGNITRLRLGLEASRAFPLANGASLSPSLEVGLRQDSGDAETGFGMDLGAGLSWNDPEQGITATVKGRTLLSHGAEDFQDQGLALSFSWQPTPSNRGASLSLSHAVGLPAEGGLAALLNPTAIEVVDDANSSGERFEARLAYGFPFYNDRLTLTPAVATAFSPSSRSYRLLWSVAPYAQQAQDDPWQLSLEGERQEHLSSPTVDHSLKLRFALNL